MAAKKGGGGLGLVENLATEPRRKKAKLKRRAKGSPPSSKDDPHGELLRDARPGRVSIPYEYRTNGAKDEVQRKMGRFLEEFARQGSVSSACLRLKIGLSSAYRWREQSPEFARAWDEIKATASDELASTLLSRARDGVVRPVYQGGMLVGAVREHDNRLGQFMLSRLDPERFGDRHQAGGAVPPEEYARRLGEAMAAQRAEAQRALASSPPVAPPRLEGA